VARPQALEVLRHRWRAVLDAVDPAAAVRLRALAADLVDAAPPGRREVAASLLAVLRTALSPADPVLLALAADDGGRRGPALLARLDDAVEQLRLTLVEIDRSLGPAPAEILDAARRILGATPTVGPDTLTGPGEDLVWLDGRLPDFQLDPAGRPRPVVVAVNRLLGARTDPWGVADWWLRANAWLGGVPAEAVGRVPDDQLLAVARAATTPE
jgi:hypothetical protein